MSAAGVCRAAAVALSGLDGTAVQVEAAVSSQLPGIVIIGLPDTALAEAKQRVRLATQQAGLPLSDRLIIVNLSPAALPKRGSGFDLAIALSALAASGRLPADRLAEVVHIGELGLDGGLRRSPGLLSTVLAAQSLGFERVMVPESCAREAALVPGIEVIAAESLRGAVNWYRGEGDGWRVVHQESERIDTARAEHGAVGDADMSDVIGQAETVEALVVAAAGRHHLSMVGPPGAGKTLLATRLASILPDLSPAESTLVSSIASLSGSSLTQLVRRPPFESPHHTASKIALVGGGDNRGVVLGAITRACHGILFLDEAPEFQESVLNSLRQPLESGKIDIDRAKVHTTLPARIQLVLASNPCPCGYADTLDSTNPCSCTPSRRVKYLERISGPLADRIDLKINVRRVSSVLVDAEGPPRATSAELRERVSEARDRSAWRLKNTPWSVNADVSGAWLRAAENRLPRSATAVLDSALQRGALSMRGYERSLKLAWTLADLTEKPKPERSEIRQALALRAGALL